MKFEQYKNNNFFCFREYAEVIESRLKRLGLMVDLLFPNAEITLGKMLSNIACRGSLYAVVISPKNKEMNSCTVNILYGIPAEHRNMPVENAIELIYKNFEQLKQGENGDILCDTEESPYASIAKATTLHSDALQHLINLLADNRCLTVLQFDCLIKYLQERREIQYKFELGDSNLDIKPMDGGDSSSVKQDQNASETAATTSQRAPSPVPKVNPEEELQKRLMEILNKPSIANITTETKPKPTESVPLKKVTASSTSNRADPPEPKILNDPKVQKALDALFL